MSAQQASDHLNNARIRIITNSEIRYEGTLYKINPDEKTITLRNVQSFGTEDRRSDKVQMASALVYEYIVFRSIEIKDLIVLKEETAGADKPAEAPKAEHRHDIQSQPKTPEPVPVAASKTMESQPREAERDRDRDRDYDDRRGRGRNEDRNRPIRSSGNFQFDKMVESLTQFEQQKHVSSAKYEAKYDNDDFFDSISSSVASDRKREIESYNDKQIDRDTFGHVPRVHFTNDYHRSRPPHSGSGGYNGGYDNRGGRQDGRYDNRYNNRFDNRGEDFRGDRQHQGNFRRPGTYEQRRANRRPEEEFEYVRKEN